MWGSNHNSPITNHPLPHPTPTAQNRFEIRSVNAARNICAMNTITRSHHGLLDYLMGASFLSRRCC